MGEGSDGDVGQQVANGRAYKEGQRCVRSCTPIVAEAQIMCKEGGEGQGHLC